MDSKTAKKVKKTVILLGGSGMLGQELSSSLASHGFKVIAPDHTELNIVDLKALTEFFSRTKPYAVINCAALIDVDKVERDPIQARKINARGAGNVAEALAKNKLTDTRLIYMSTSYVFGNKSTHYTEKDNPSPLNVYGKSKAEGEALVAKYAHGAHIPYFVIRTSWLYSKFKNTFVDFVAQTLLENKMIKASKEQYGNPTSARDLAEAIIKEFLVGSKDSGIYHLINRSETKGVSRYEMALCIARSLVAPLHLIDGDAKDIFKVPRPNRAALVNTKSPPLPVWSDSLKKYIVAQYKK